MLRHDRAGRRAGLGRTGRGLKGPATAAELADRAGLDERNTEVWLRAMAANGPATREGDKYAATETLAMILSPAFPNDFRAVLDLVHANFAPRVHAATDAMRSGRGFGWEQWAAVGDIVGRLNTPTCRRALVEEWIATAPGLAGRLAGGGRIADVACGNGDAVAVMAAAFPASEVTGYDPVVGTKPITS